MSVSRRLFCGWVMTSVPLVAHQLRPSAPPESRGYFGGFRIGLHSRCYSTFTLQEAITHTRQLGLRYMELAPAHLDFRHAEVAQLREERRKLLDAGISVHSYGVATFWTRDEQRDLEQVFRRAQEFGLRVLVIDPEPSLLLQIDRLARRYGVAAALSNHVRQPGRDQYAAPGATAEAIKPYDSCGAAVDVANFLSSGEDPVKAIEMLKGRILSVRLASISHPGERVQLGEGLADVPRILKALRNQRYAGVVLVDYPDGVGNPLVLSASIDYLKQVTSSVQG